MGVYDPGGPPAPAPPRRRPAPYNPYPNGPYHVDDPDPGGRNTTYYPGGVGSGSTGQPQGPQTPPPAAPAPAPPAPPPPPKIDWAAYLKSDPGYAAAIANLQGQESNLLTQYGAVPTGVQQIGGGDVGADIANAARNNPYSTLAMLQKQLTGNLHQDTNEANSHGVLFSGVNLNNQRNEYAADQQRQYGALQSLQQALLGLSGQQTQAQSQAYQNWFNYFNSQVPSG